MHRSSLVVQWVALSLLWVQFLAWKCPHAADTVKKKKKKKEECIYVYN